MLNIPFLTIPAPEIILAFYRERALRSSHLSAIKNGQSEVKIFTENNTKDE
jgi:hypothetical protein